MAERRETSRFFMGVDLGQASDPTAIAIVRRVKFEHQDGFTWCEEKPSIFQVGHLERVPLHTPYPAIVTRVRHLMSHPICAGNVDLSIDQTGVGGPVADMFRQAGIDFTGVVITGGQEETSPSANLAHVPKLKLVSHLQALLHEGRLQSRSRDRACAAIALDLGRAPDVAGLCLRGNCRTPSIRIPAHDRKCMAS